VRNLSRLVAALCALAAACDERAPPPASPGPPAAQSPPSSAPRAGDRTAPLRRGDRHARAAAQQARRVRAVVGTVVRAGEDQVAIRPRDGPELTLRIGPSTVLPAPAPGRARLAPGDEIRAAWRTGGEDPPTAISVERRDAGRGEPAEPPDPWTDRG
jgi:hypothetical protein